MPKHRHGSVERNLLKRRLREIARTTILPALASVAPVDVVIRSRPEAYTAPFTELAAELVRATERLVRLHGVAATPATTKTAAPADSRSTPPSPPTASS